MEAVKLRDYREQFLSEKAGLLGRIEALETDKARALDANSIEQAVDVQNDEVAERLEDIERKRLNEIDFALSRIEEGKFGICSVCGNEISDARLKAMPAAIMCMNCLEDEGLV